MQARITHTYRCAPEGHTTVQFEPGTIVDGAVAEMAILDGHAIKIEAAPLETKITPAPEIKDAPKKGRAKK